jgi:hypothetical protein
MSTLFAFLHHLCAFTLVSAVAIEFALIRGELTLSSARRLQVTDLVFGIAAGALLVIGLLRVFFFRKGRGLLFPQPRLSDKTFGLCRHRAVVDRADHGISVVERRVEGRPVARHQREEIETGHRGHSWRTSGHCDHPALCCDHGPRRMGVGLVFVIPARAPARTRNFELIISGFQAQPWRAAPE